MKNCNCTEIAPCLNAAMAEIEDAFGLSWRLEQIAFLGLGYAATAVRRKSNAQLRAKGITLEESITALAALVKAEGN